MHPHWMFIGNVLAHLVASMSGLASFLFSLWEHSRKPKRVVESWAFFAVGVICLIVAFDQSWQDEHRNSEALKSEKLSAVIQRNFWEAQFYREQGQLNSVNQVLAQNFGALAQSQKTGNETQQSLTRLSEKILEIGKGPKAKTIVLPIGREHAFDYLHDDNANNIEQVLMLTNVTIIPTTVEIYCPAPVVSLPRIVILTPTGGMTAVSHQQLGPSAFRFNVQTPWTPQNPMLVEMPFSKGNKPMQCQVGTR